MSHSPEAGTVWLGAGQRSCGAGLGGLGIGKMEGILGLYLEGFGYLVEAPQIAAVGAYR